MGWWTKQPIKKTTLIEQNDFQRKWRKNILAEQTLGARNSQHSSGMCAHEGVINEEKKKRHLNTMPHTDQLAVGVKNANTKIPTKQNSFGFNWIN